MRRRALLGSDRRNYMLIHFDDPDLGIRNEGYGGYVGVNIGYTNAITSNQAKFGDYSVYLNGDYVHQGCDFYISYLPKGDYTLEFWFYRQKKAWQENGSSVNPIVYGHQGISSVQLMSLSDRQDKLDYFYLGYNFDSSMNASFYNYSFYDTVHNSYAYNNAADKWCHIAYTYNSSNDQCTMYVAGKRAVTFTIETDPDQNPPAWTFGNSAYGVYSYFDELRVTPRILYTGSTITVPTQAFEN